MEYILPVKRLTNGYSDFDELHIQQMLIARLAFNHQCIQNNLRKKAKEIVN